MSDCNFHPPLSKTKAHQTYWLIRHVCDIDACPNPKSTNSEFEDYILGVYLNRTQDEAFGSNF